MATVTPNHQIAAGNDNAAGLTALNVLTDANGVKFVFPRCVPFHEDGMMVIGPNGAPAYDGFAKQDWEFRIMTVAQYELLKGTYTGLVTVKTCLDGSTFVNRNAAAWIDPKPDGDYVPNAIVTMYDPDFTGPCYLGIRLHLLRLEAL